MPKDILQANKLDRIEYNTMQHDVPKISKVWQIQNLKHQIFQHLPTPPAQPNPT